MGMIEVAARKLRKLFVEPWITCANLSWPDFDPAIQGLQAANALLDRRVKPGDDKEDQLIMACSRAVFGWTLSADLQRSSP